MKRTAPTPDLFAGQPEITSSPKYSPKEPATPAELAQVQAQLWEHAPQHVRGIIRGENCIFVDAYWQPITKLTPAELVAAFSIQ